MRILITGTSQGIGRAIALKFLKEGHHVIGFDRLEKSINHKKYRHYIYSIGNKNELPELENINVIINNAGSLFEKEAISEKLMGSYYISEKYAFNKKIKSVLFISSNSAHYGIELPLYCICNGGLLSYTKNLAKRLAQYGATVNSVSPGYVDTTIDQHVKDAGLSKEIIDNCLLKHIIDCEEIAELCYYLTIVNSSITGQDILIDCGECLNSNFVETKENIEKYYKSNL